MPSQGLSALLLPFLLILLVGFMFWSQRRRQRAAVDLQSSIEVGDEVCTTSGLFGRVTAMDDLVMHLEVSPGSVVKFDRRAVAVKVTTGAPATPDVPVSLASPVSPVSPMDEK